MCSWSLSVFIEWTSWTSGVAFSSGILQIGFVSQVSFNSIFLMWGFIKIRVCRNSKILIIQFWKHFHPFCLFIDLFIYWVPGDLFLCLLFYVRNNFKKRNSRKKREFSVRVTLLWAVLFFLFVLYLILFLCPRRPINK